MQKVSKIAFIMYLKFAIKSVRKIGSNHLSSDNCTFHEINSYTFHYDTLKRSKNKKIKSRERNN